MNPQKKRLFGTIFLAVGILLIVILAIFSKKEKTADKPTNKPSTITLPAEQQATAQAQQPQAPQQALDPNLANGQLSTVHGFGNKDKGELVAVPSQYTQKDEFVHADVYAPLMAMIKAAEADGIRISIVSAYRSYDHQKRIWERKWGDAPDTDINQALKNLEYSSFPGTSRHHWGTDIDFNSVSPAYWQNGEGKRTHDWLVANAPLYGFCQTYGDNRSTGYANEDWHWSHMPTASRYYNLINNPQVLAIATSQPLKGAAAVRQLDNKLYDYIRGISPCSDVNYQTSQPQTQSQPQPQPQPQQIQAQQPQPQPVAPQPVAPQKQVQPVVPIEPVGNDTATGQKGSW